MDPGEFFSHPVPLGTNLYNKDDRAPVHPPTRQFDTVAPTGPSASGGGSAPAESPSFSRNMSSAGGASVSFQGGASDLRALDGF